MRRTLAVCVALFSSSCVSFEYQRDIIEREPDAVIVEGLLAGTARLEDVLGALGAPIDVWEGANGNPVLSYGGLRSREWNVDVSVPITDSGSASLSYTDTTAKTRGTVFVFDDQLRLHIVRSGLLGDLRRVYARRRPASVDEDEGTQRP